MGAALVLTLQCKDLIMQKIKRCAGLGVRNPLIRRGCLQFSISLSCCSSTTSQARMRGLVNGRPPWSWAFYEHQKGPGPPANKNIMSGSKVGSRQGQPSSPRRSSSGGCAHPAAQAYTQSKPAVGASSATCTLVSCFQCRIALDC